MGTISSGIGLISGLPINDLVEQLMAIEARPRNLAQQQISKLDQQKAAWLDLSARLLALKSAAGSFDDTATFQVVAATSSSTSVLTASAKAGAAEGNYSFTPVRLMTSHQVISAGRPDSDTTAVGAGTLTIEFGHGHLNATTSLDFLNGQSGVGRGTIRITDRGGNSADIDLSTAMTLDEVLDAINDAPGLAVTASVSGDSIVLTDTSASPTGSLTVSDLNGGTAAADLGILGTAAGATLTGSDIVSINTSTSLTPLNDGNGIRTRAGDDIKITLEDGTELLIDLSDETTVGGVLDAINNATGNGGKLVAAVAGDGDRLTLTDTTGGGGTLTVEAVSTSQAARDLGLLGSDGDADHLISGGRLAGGLNTVLLRNLNGGTGVSAGSIDITDRSGANEIIDLSSAETVQDVLDALNAAATVSISASLNASGNGITVADTSGGSAVNFTIAESGGTTGADLNILHDATTTTSASGNLQHRYIGENTTLAQLGVSRGRFTITDSSGKSATVDLTQGNEENLADVIAEINSRGIGVTASINSTGDGLLLTDTAGGAGQLSVAEQGSSTASDLGILGTDSGGLGYIDGSLELSITLDAADTLEDLADAINAAGGRASAVVINDGTSTNPYRLVVTSKSGGTGGRLIIDAGGTGMNFSTMVDPQDALLFLGDPSNPNSIPIRAQSNSITNVINGVTINLLGTSTTPVNISVTRSIDTVVSSIKTFVTSFNDTIARIDKLTEFDAEAGTRGVLQGETVVARIRSELFSMVTGTVSDAPGQYTRLGQIGFSVTSNGTKISFDEETFRQAWAKSPSSVSGLFTLADSGVGDRIDEALTDFTDNFTGTVQIRMDTLDDRRAVLADRIKTLTALLDRKQTRLLAQFRAMESALAQLQSQQSALSGLAAAVTFATSGGLFRK